MCNLELISHHLTYNVDLHQVTLFVVSPNMPSTIFAGQEPQYHY
jgi:hypothetical protein